MAKASGTSSTTLQFIRAIMNKPPVELEQEEPQNEFPPFVESPELVGGERYLGSDHSYEIEASFGYFKEKQDPETKEISMGFIPGVTATEFNSLLTLFQKRLSDSYREHQQSTTVKISEKGVRHIIYHVEGAKPIHAWQEKKRSQEDTLNNQTWGYRISKSTETHLDGKPAGFTPVLTRVIQRYSFEATSPNVTTYSYRFDLSSVKETRKDQTHRKYEVEIERIHPPGTHIPYDMFENFERAIQLVLRGMQDVEGDDLLMTQEEKRKAIKQHNALFAGDIRSIEEATHKEFKFATPYYIFKDYWNKPVNVRLDDLLAKDLNSYAVTAKLDGVRRFIFITATATYAVGPPDDITKIGAGIPALNGTLLDAEAYYPPPAEDITEWVTTYYVFDILFSGTGGAPTDLRYSDLKTRFVFVNQLVRDINRYNLLTDKKIEMKRFFTEGGFYDKVKGALAYANDLSGSGYLFDGLIFQSPGKYREMDREAGVSRTKKWKPSIQMTIDFRLVYSKDLDGLVPFVGGRGGEVLFTGTTSHPYPSDETIIVPKTFRALGTKVSYPQKYDGMIAECQWKANKGRFKLYRLRDDRDKPNAQKTAMDVWTDIQKPITVETIEGEDLKVMRRYHNIVKHTLLEKHFREGGVIMDWGSGRGGDIRKWANLKLRKVYAVEPNVETIKEFSHRLAQIKGRGPAPDIIIAKTKKLLGAQDTKELVALTKDDDLDGIVAFFSLTFFTGDEKMYKAMIESVDSLLPPGGKFIGIVMDGTRVRKDLEKTSTNVAYGLIDNNSFSIRQESPFCDKIQRDCNTIKIKIKDETSMVDQIEWLFYFNKFKDDLERRNFTLLQTYFLEGREAAMLPPDSKLFSSYNRVFIFQKEGSVESVPKGLKAQKVLAEAKKAMAKSKKGGEEEGEEEEAEGEEEEVEAEGEEAEGGEEEGEEEDRPAPKLTWGRFHKARGPVFVSRGALEGETHKLDNKYGADLYQIGVKRGVANFAYALVSAVSRVSKEKQANYVDDLRKVLGKKVIVSLYERLNGGALAKEYEREASRLLNRKKHKKFITDAEIKSTGYQTYINNITNPETPLTLEDTWELFSIIFKKNILILGGDTNPIIRSEDKKDPGYTRKKLESHTDTILLITHDGHTFSVVGRKGMDGEMRTLYKTQERLIQDIINEGLIPTEAKEADFED